MRRYAVNPAWRALLKDLGLEPQDVLRAARLPLDLFSRTAPAVTAEQMYEFWDSVSRLLDDPELPLKLGQAISPELFTPELFASFCSPDLDTALERLARFKPLIAPLRIEIERTPAATTAVIDAAAPMAPPPATFFLFELVFLTKLARLATREAITPLAIETTAPLPQSEPYEAFFRAPVARGPRNRIAFSAADAKRPFLVANEGMWRAFEPDLRRRLADLDRGASMKERVRAILLELLPSGRGAVGDTAHALALSERSLQRQLALEGTSFKMELSELREELARHYLLRTPYSNAEISFLLGYADPNSFIRAFHLWTGATPDAMRAAGEAGPQFARRSA